MSLIILSVLSRLKVSRPEMTVTFKDYIEDSKYLEITARDLVGRNQNTSSCSIDVSWNPWDP